MKEDDATHQDLANSLHDLLADLPSNDSDHTMNRPSWTLRSRSSDHDITAVYENRSPPAQGVFSRPRSTSRSNLSRQRIPPVHLSDTGSSTYEPQSTSSQLSPPPRSIFATGPSAASVSVNTTHASMSTASAASRPLGAFSGSGMSRLTSPRAIEPLVTAATVTIPGTEKDVDDIASPSNFVDQEGSAATTSQNLSNLFSTDAETPGILSREATHFRTLSSLNRPPSDASTLTGHLLYNGFLGGRHSDITIRAFGQTYRLHKLILDRAPFFSSAFSGPWIESSAREINVLPDDVDPNITQNAFELALKRLYGTAIPAHEEQDAVGLFATACWLDMPDLVDVCVDYILRQMSTARLHNLIKLVTNNYYGKAGDRILTSAKAMLCREGWEMPYEYWDHIPAEIVREIIGGDAFYVPGEWERWFLATKLLNRRLRRLSIETGLVASNGHYIHPKPQSLRFFALRFDTTYRRNAESSAQRSWSNKDDAWASLYTSPEIAPILVLLEEGIHYVHLRFEQLQHIKSTRDILGIPVLPEKSISDALWMSMELRQLILNAHEGDLELGLSEVADNQEEVEQERRQQQQLSSEAARGKQREDTSVLQSTVEIDSGSWDGNGQPRKFWIPSTDISCIMGGAREAVATPSATNSGDWTAAATRLSASLEANDVAWAADFAGSMFESSSIARNVLSTSQPRYSMYPPFRFSAEFPNPRTLREKKRVYSQTVWYAGSMWNLYIQRVNTTKSQQLGIYLHRAKDKDPSDDPLAQFVPASVDDRIGRLEREMLLRKTDRNTRVWRDDAHTGQLDHEDHRLSSNDIDRVETPDPADPSSGRSPTFRQRTYRKDSQTTSTIPASSPTHRRNTPSQETTVLDMLPPESDEDDAYLIRANQKFNNSVATMPPYIDSRSTIKTYFKIYSPSKAGRLLSVYESAPDSFNFGKSWGWKSSQMVLDDGLGPGGNGTSKDGKLRYMVVIGNV